MTALSFCKHLIPRPVRRLVRAFFPPGAPAPAVWPPRNIYETLYDGHGLIQNDQDVVGAGSFDLIGRIELGLLIQEGLKPTDTLLDFGCGTGRLAVHAIPFLTGGRYIGVDVSQPMLDKADKRVREHLPHAPCQISWVKQTAPVFPFEDHSIDVLCAFSVFTHIEHEDSYRYLVEARRIMRPGGRFLFSCLPLTNPLARDVFLASAADDFVARWSKVRNVTTSVEMMNAMATLAGWTILHWYAGDESNVRLPPSGELAALGQSTCVLVAPADPLP